MLKPNEMAKRLGVTVKTLQKWDNAGKFKAHRTPTNRRYYTEDQYLDYIGQADEPKKRRQVAYARVSNIGQKDDLTDQIDFCVNTLMEKALFWMRSSQILVVGLTISAKMERFVR